MQIHGRKCKIHLDPAIAASGESPAVMQVDTLNILSSSHFVLDPILICLGGCGSFKSPFAVLGCLGRANWTI